ncbi:TIGR00730 family Rossman fold protein [Candidatus Saccharibacteria bacterium]|nr:TIGR00730 family Rossman fold protein [Candidatus Saccharibacteria bacterium]MDO5474969.1 TIGR00730 family Rossman fold protein [Candidatus Saccharibacteria bacterium]
MFRIDEELLKKLSIEDLERANAYAKDLTMGLQIIRSFPQGVTIFGSARLPQDNKYCKKAYELGGLLAKNGHAVITGGGPGIMEAANHGSYEIGGRSIGLNITLKHEQFPNPYLTDSITFEYFFARKVSLAMAAKVFVFFPGGFGTMDEIAEILCLMQEDKMPKMPMFLIGKDYWKNFDKAIKTMIELGLISEADTKIFKVTDDIKEVVKAANKIGHPKISENFYDGFKEASALNIK